MGNPMPVLVVDDSSMMRRITRNALMRCGYANVTEAENGVQALAKCQGAQFGFIITDWNMPEMDGLQFTMAIRQNPNYANVPIMMVTTEGCNDDILEALTKGVTAYIVKPFTVELFMKKMGEIFPA